MSKQPWFDSTKPRLEIERRPPDRKQRRVEIPCYPATDYAAPLWSALLLAVLLIVFIAVLAATATPMCE